LVTRRVSINRSAAGKVRGGMSRVALRGRFTPWGGAATFGAFKTHKPYLRTTKQPTG